MFLCLYMHRIIDIYAYTYIYFYIYICTHLGFLDAVLRIYPVEAPTIPLTLEVHSISSRNLAELETAGGTRPYGKNGVLMVVHFILFALISPIPIKLKAPRKSWFNRRFTHDWHHLGNV